MNKWMLLLLIVCIAGFFTNPAVSDAKETCYVDQDGDDGDGSEDDPFEDIEEALGEDCDEVRVAKGSYSEDIIIGKSVTVRGDSKDSVEITGVITMKDGAKIKEVTVSSGGIDVDDDADVTVEDVKIKDTSIGIKTTGRGKLTVRDAKIYGNRKGMYLQAGKKVDIADSEVSDNDEEGIDIRANVDGSITSNTITGNGESGIEVILGKSELNITKNSIKKNGASGIAAQYYKSSSKIGAVKIKDNTITNNKDYGVNCKAPSGGNPGSDYWSASTYMTSNKVYGNKDGDFSPSCSFSDMTVTDATRTKEEKEAAEKKAAQEKAEQEKLSAQAREQEEAVKKKEAQDRQREAEQEALRKQLQKDQDLKSEIFVSIGEIDKFREANSAAQKRVEGRNSFLTFLIGPSYKELQSMKTSLSIYDQKIEEVKAAKSEIDDGEIAAEVHVEIEKMAKERGATQALVSAEEKEFSLLGWLFNRS